MILITSFLRILLPWLLGVAIPAHDSTCYLFSILYTSPSSAYTLNADILQSYVQGLLLPSFILSSHRVAMTSYLLFAFPAQRFTHTYPLIHYFNMQHTPNRTNHSHTCTELLYFWKDSIKLFIEIYILKRAQVISLDHISMNFQKVNTPM